VALAPAATTSVAPSTSGVTQGDAATEAFESVGSHFVGLVPYPAGCGECFCIAPAVTRIEGIYKITTVSLEGLSSAEHEAFTLYGSPWDISSSWRSSAPQSILRRVEDGQLFWSTGNHGRVPFQARRIVPTGLLQSGRYALDSLDTIRASKERLQSVMDA
jgi:hypothetical protein